ncbi:hypothetical protein B0T26DRAFT_252890 [Lasiosphaeria miniovina]|uniref:DUF2293 domain-containing protein n=1 Tax=Lasiosphaeria miniovina TaxID=1954250 RepID=A0AA40AW89_9PEZI|nr:uncharacterized protein B0T26DRAFT_252890 [Lasiosphaeria miniovina]KAK0723161.1 hypothetical protein B0T26DRAFT_252890 [Lasiosphaeria miniovina]
MWQVTNDEVAPPGFEFVPIGNPRLIEECKELCREMDAMIFVVTQHYGPVKPGLETSIGEQVNRIGYHFRQSIVDQARELLGPDEILGMTWSGPEPILERQEDINKQADAAIRELFPRIPNTDREMIIQRSFNKANCRRGKEPPVGLAEGVPLTRRVHLAVSAHIRHTHTRYDELLKQTTWVNSRRAVEQLCLDFLLKWRGDEESGRDQLDEILREVIVISDSESDSDDDDDDELPDAHPAVVLGDASIEVKNRSSVGQTATSVSTPNAGGNSGPHGGDPRIKVKDLSSAEQTTPSPVQAPWIRFPLPLPSPRSAYPFASLGEPSREDGRTVASLISTLHLSGDGGQSGLAYAARKARKDARRERSEKKKAQKGFGRYKAAYEQAMERKRLEENEQARSSNHTAMARSASHASQSWRRAESERASSELQGVQRVGDHSRLDAYNSPLQPLEVRRGNPELPGYGDASQQTADLRLYRFPHESRAQETQSSNGFRPIVGSQNTFQTGIQVEQPKQFSQEDLKDHLVRSVEPSSPALPNFPSWSVAQPCQAEPVPRGFSASAEVVSYPRRGFTRHGEVDTARAYHTIQGQDGFVTLPPRTQNLPAAVPQAHGVDRGYTPLSRSGALDTHPLPAYYDDMENPERRPILRSEFRPAWSEESFIVDAGNRSILISDTNVRQRESMTNASHNPHPSHAQTLRTSTGGFHQLAPVYVADRTQQYSRAGGNGNADSHLDDCVEFVRVSDKFPRRYEPQPPRQDGETYEIRQVSLVDSERYEARPGPVRYEPQSLRVDAEVYEFQPGAQRREPYRVDDRAADSPSGVARHSLSQAVELRRPEYRQGRMSPIPRQIDGYSSNIQRRERVVGIEYVSLQAHQAPAYVDSAYGEEGWVYRPLTSSVAAGPYPAEYQKRPNPPPTGSDEVIILD